MTKEELARIIKEYVAKQLPEPVVVDVEAIAVKAAALIPAPEHGKNADPVDLAEVAKQAAALIPKPGDGQPGKDAEPVSIESVIAAVSAKFERRFSDMQLSWERQARDTFEKAVDKMPVPKDGKDALPVEDIEIKQEGRLVTIKLGTVERTIKLDTVLDQGVWRDGDYEKGDAVTYGGSLWIAQVDDPKDAPGTSKDWRLAVKKGRDGRDLRDTASIADKSKGVKL